MLIPQLFSIAASAVVLGTSITHLPPLFSGISDCQHALTHGVSSTSTSPSSSSTISDSGELVDATIDSASFAIATGDLVSLTDTTQQHTSGSNNPTDKNNFSAQVTFGFHLLLMRYPLDTYLAASASSSAPDAGGEQLPASVVTIAAADIRANGAAAKGRSFSSASAAGAVTFGDDSSVVYPDGAAPPSLARSDAVADLMRQHFSAAAAPSSPFSALSPTILVNSSRGIVGIDQCSVLVPAAAATAQRGFFDMAIDVSTDTDDGSDATSLLSDSDLSVARIRRGSDSLFGPAGIDGTTTAVPTTAPAGNAARPFGAVPTGTTLTARRTSTALVLFWDETRRLAPTNEYPHFSSDMSAGTFAPHLSYAAADKGPEGYNRGARGFPLSSDAFFLLKYRAAARELTSERMPIPLVIDEDPTDAVSVFPFGLHGARSGSSSSGGGDSSSSSLLGSTAAANALRSAVFLVPIPRTLRTANFPTSDAECVRFGVNRSTATTNNGLAPSPIGGSVPLLYHRGCFVAVVAQIGAVAAAADAVTSVMGTVVAQWWAKNAGRVDGVYSDSVVALRRIGSDPSVPSTSEDIIARDGSRWGFGPVRLGPAVGSAVYVDVVAPMRDVFSQYLPPLFVSWIGGLYAVGHAAGPQFLDELIERRVSVRL